MDGDIAVILDPTQKQVLLSRGMPEERIIVVPQELIMVANTAVSQS